ncbi:MAG TPA: low molecular weight protein-tyrosine-phosphatase [Dokdonella sp.]|uniref:low molecular weight protein-tyrosine-phosphatase n=1 Tax=Dokdonella sp. TaxID=2291710 RepID=UPI002CCE4388|nr:low molecular weight protein-tyrosine-phosphatase [Dokdonella sp.]HUD42009.1 low molecular weight protein-tyrosine-phosphatase [Dokdonella sp.]
MTRVLFVCMGNICRSPTVEAVARVELARAGLAATVASAGTEDYHVGAPADRRAVAVAEAAGYPMAAHRARQVGAADFADYDHVLGMDTINLRALERVCPAASRDRVALFLPFAGFDAHRDVPDPYYGSQRDFEQVLRLAREGVAALAERLRREDGSRR